MVSFNIPHVRRGPNSPNRSVQPFGANFGTGESYLEDFNDNADLLEAFNAEEETAEAAGDAGGNAGDNQEGLMEGEEDVDDWVFPRNQKKYHSVLIRFMRFKDDINYQKGYIFSKEEMLTIRPVHVRKWLNQLAFGVPKPAPDDRPINMRAESLQKMKQAISYYHPNKHVPWVDGRGNPTIHASIHALLKSIRKFETRSEGREANDKREYTAAEFKFVMTSFQADPNPLVALKYMSMALLMKQLIHRVDDTCYFRMDTPHGNIEHPFALKARTKDSKNVLSDQNCPPQLLLAAKTWSDCVILHLAVYLEEWCLMNMSTNVFLYAEGNDKKKSPIQLKQRFLRKLKGIWGSEQFKALDDQVGDRYDRRGVGGHSSRKYAATLASRLGASDKQVESRGRWQGERNKRVVSARYISPEDAYSDALVASLLCDGGPIAYELTPELEIPEVWLFDLVIPNIRQRYHHDIRMCRVLAYAYLWAAFDEEASAALMIDRERIVTEFSRCFFPVAGPPEGYNPVIKKKLLVRQGPEGGLRLSKFTPSSGGDDNQQSILDHNEEVDLAQAMVTGGHGTMIHHESLLHNIVNLMDDMKQNMDLQFQQVLSSLGLNRSFQLQQFNRINNNVRRYGGTIQSAFANQVRQQIEGTSQQQQQQQQQLPSPPRIVGRYRTSDPKATLAPRIRDLTQLWLEYTTGIDGRKAAKDFSPAERGAAGVKQKYYRRMNVWRIQARLMDGGMNVYAANALISQVTGGNTVTKVIDTIIKFKRTYASAGGCHPRLRNGPVSVR